MLLSVGRCEPLHALFFVSEMPHAYRDSCICGKDSNQAARRHRYLVDASLWAQVSAYAQ